MKKILSIVLAAILMMTSFVVPTSAEGPITFELVLPKNYNHGTGEVITAEIHVHNNTEGMSSVTFYIDLPEFLTTATVNPDECVFSTNLTVGYLASAGWASDGEHRLSIGLLGLRTYKGDGAIVTINLKPTPDATKEDLEDMSVTLGVRETKTSDDVTHNGEDEDVQISDSPIKTPEITCSHPETEKVEAKEPTCTEPGYTEGTKCKFCGEPIGSIQQIPAKNHDFQYDKTIEEATCTNVGKDLYKCSRCGETEEREVKMKEHEKSSDYKHDDNSHWCYCINCDSVIGAKETHKPDATWHNEDVSVNGHYRICSVCKAVVKVEEHVDKDNNGECDVCKAALHEHIWDTAWKYDDEGHYHECTVPGCTAKYGKTAHDLTTETTKEATCTENGEKTTSCSVCDYKKVEKTETIPHTQDTEWHTEKGSASHWHICTVCGTVMKDTEVPHKYGEYTSDSEGHTRTCADCKAVETGEHNESADFKKDGENHWHYCTVCGYEFEKSAHNTSKEFECDPTGHWSVCDDCGEKYDFDPHSEAVLTPKKEATSEEDGNVAYWYCSGCEKYFYDSNGKIGVGPYDSADRFTTKYNVGCNGNHLLLCVPVNDIYHMVLCGRRCGFVMTVTHRFGLNGVCIDCGYSAPVQDVGFVGSVGGGNEEENTFVSVETPTEGKFCPDETN